MASTSKITERGQTTIPTRIRKQLRAKVGDTLEYEVTPHGVTIRVKKPDIRLVLAKYSERLGSAPEADLVAEQRERREWDALDVQLLEGVDESVDDQS